MKQHANGAATKLSMNVNPNDMNAESMKMAWNTMRGLLTARSAVRRHAQFMPANPKKTTRTKEADDKTKTIYMARLCP
jgi:hypothetical protein